MVGNTGKVEKLEIKPYEKNDFKTAVKDKFEVMINPSGYSIDYSTNYNMDKSIGASGDNQKFNSSDSPKLNLEFLLDGTGVTEANTGNALINKIKKKGAFSATTVSEQLDNFYRVTGKYNGDIHKPYNVEITWGALTFQGVLENVSVDFSLFNNEGHPLRAMVKAQFGGSISLELQNKKVKINSPDLTHTRTVKAGDTLPLMTERIYGDSKYYLEVAKANNLFSFRQLTPGQELFFPPLEKVS